MPLLRILFVALVAYPVVLVVLGLNVRNRVRLPRGGPAIVAANHNSHLDTLVLFTLFPLLSIPRVRPVAAADYFLANRFIAWFALNVIGIIPLQRKRTAASGDPLAGCYAALERGETLLIFPEGVARRTGADERTEVRHRASRGPFSCGARGAGVHARSGQIDAARRMAARAVLLRCICRSSAALERRAQALHGWTAG
jgi:1-acyl-sn-glycerol-3-phosphate acyltransferase